MPHHNSAAQPPAQRARAGRVAVLTHKLSAFASRLRLDSVFLATSLVFGVLLVLLVPPFQNPDEPSHFFKMWSLAEGQLFLRGDSTVVLPKSVADLPARLGSSMIDWSQNTYVPSTAVRALSEPVAAPPRRVFCSAGANGPLGYLPAIAAVNGVRIVGRSPLAALYLARLFNLLTATLLTYFAVRLAPFGKALFAFTGLLPMTTSQFASLGPDALGISGALLFVSLALRFSQKSRLSRSDIILLGAAAALLLNAKQGFAVLALLILLIPPSALRTWRRYALSVAAILVCVAVVALIPMLLAPGDAEAIKRLWGPGLQAQPGLQVDFVLHHPWAFAKVLGSTLDSVTLVLLQQSVGVLGWLTVFLPQVLMVLVFVLLAVLFSYREIVPLRDWQRGVLAGVAALYVIGVMAALYIGWSPLTSPVVTGLQGRYFIACIPIGLLVLYRLPAKRFLLPVVIVCIGVLAAVSTLAAIAHFYYP